MIDDIEEPCPQAIPIDHTPHTENKTVLASEARKRYKANLNRIVQTSIAEQLQSSSPTNTAERGQNTGNRGQNTAERGQNTGNRGQNTGNRGQNTAERGHTPGSQATYQWSTSRQVPDYYGSSVTSYYSSPTPMTRLKNLYETSHIKCFMLSDDRFLSSGNTGESKSSDIIFYDVRTGLVIDEKALHPDFIPFAYSYVETVLPILSVVKTDSDEYMISQDRDDKTLFRAKITSIKNNNVVTGVIKIKYNPSTDVFSTEYNPCMIVPKIMKKYWNYFVSKYHVATKLKNGNHTIDYYTLSKATADQVSKCY